MFAPVLKIWTCSNIEDIHTNDPHWFFHSKAFRSLFFRTYLLFSLYISRKLWSEAVRFRFLAHLSSTLHHQCIESQFVFVTFWSISVYSCDFALSLFELNKRSFWNTQTYTHPRNKQLSSLLFLLFRLSRLIRIFVSIMDINVIIRSCDVQSTEARNTNNQSSKGNSWDKSIQWTKPM